ncbi:MAG: hypothetical protein LBE27_07870 [Deltaproteobacteria bacterium]|nr:hypothetical protein [Deltaproteobacteria bacterium]
MFTYGTTLKSRGSLASELKEQGFNVSYGTIKKSLHELNYTLRSKKKNR